MESPQTAIICPECSSKLYDKAGFRYLNDFAIQRFKCKKCGCRFSDPTALNVLDNDKSFSRIGANIGAKNLASAQKTKICVGNERIPQETRGLLVKFIAYMEKEGYYENSSYPDLISSLATDGTNLLDPEDVKVKIARHTYKFKNGREGKWMDSTKALAVQAYDLFCEMQGLEWIKPTYKSKETILIVPEEKDLDSLIATSKSKRMRAFLTCLRETYCDPGEILALEWKEIKGNIIMICHPCKGHYAGEYEVSNRLIQMLNRLPKTDKRVFPTKYTAMYTCMIALRKMAARNLQNPALLDINFKSFRHFGGSMIAHYTNGNVLAVQKALRHKSVLNTMKYIHTIQNLRDDDFEETTASTSEEIRKLGKAGWTKYDEMTTNGVTIHFYRKPKRFGVS